MAKGGGKSGGGKGGMDKEAAARIQSAGARNPNSPTARDGFDRRAQSAADRADPEDGDC